MGWFWVIPTFHMHREPGAQRHATTFTLKRKELDFAMGLGANIIDVAVSMEWCAEAAEVASPAVRDVGQNGTEGMGVDDPHGIAATITAVMAGDTREMVHAKQVED